MKPHEFSSIAETAHSAYGLRTLIAQWIDAHDLEALKACIAFCQQQEKTHAKLGFVSVFTPTDVSDGSTLPLFAAVKRDQVDTVRLLIASGCGIEQRDSLGRTPLLSAFSNNALAVASWLIEQGADIHAVTRLNTRVFDMVLTLGDAYWVDWFLAKGLSLNHTNQSGFSSLHRVCACDNVDMVMRVHRETGLSFLQPTANGQRPLDQCNNLTVFSAIARLHPDAALDIRFTNGNCSLLAFASRGCTDIVCHLLDQGADPSQVNSQKNTLMHCAVESGEVALVQELIRRKISVEGRNRGNYRPLHWAVINGNLELVKLLVEAGRAKVNIKGNQNFIIRETKTPLYLAIEGGFGEIARYLVAHGADVNAVNDSSCRTAVEAAAGTGDVPLLRFLLERGGSPNGVSNNKNDPSDFYCFPLANAASAEVVDTLVEFGAHINAENRSSIWSHGALRSLVGKVTKESLGTRRSQAQLGAIAAMLRHGASLKDGQGNVLPDAKCAEVAQLLLAAEKAQAPVAPQPAENAIGAVYRGLIQGLASVLAGGRLDKNMREQETERGRTGVGQAMFAMSANCRSTQELEAFSTLLQAASKEDVNYKTEDSFYDKQTTLHRITNGFRCYKPDGDYAAISQWALCITTLLDKGADPNAIETLYGETPLHKVAKASVNVFDQGDNDLLLDCFQRFVDAGANPNIASESGAHAIDLLIHPALVSWFKERGAVHGRFPECLFDAVTYGQPAILAALIGDAENRFGLHNSGVNLAEFWAMDITPPERWAAALENAQILLSHGFQFDAIAQDGSTPLSLACAQGALLQAQWLFEQFTYDLNHRNRDGAVPLGLLLNAPYPSGFGDLSQKDFKKRRDALALRMVQRGARLDLADNNGDTPLDLCRTLALRKQLERAARDFTKLALSSNPASLSV
ncbi:ankyrin repeat domain-containing protein [Pseudomarimonas arenosa]|uniref:Ankyrin repeat domain-containing protein n=1 Tax=Pseudomarimonas arenosa TaxID=2774145 RepID=A0AAW3ZU00_9GAMM|nr:ankyrin repeat domain-containing protein [Pseudomarimonas arenosa]MBD8527827.1 ankyrin repeat domain-containing protein [Pseudomarimonas arenosa]